MFALDRMKQYLRFAVTVLMLMDAFGYTFGAIGPIRRAMNPAETYWQKRLLLNLMLANEGMYFAAATAFIGAMMKITHQQGANVLFALTLATCIYTLVTVPLLTPSDSAHIVPRAVAAILIVVGFIVT